MHIHIAVSGYIKKSYAAVRSLKYSLRWLDDTEYWSIVNCETVVRRKKTQQKRKLNTKILLSVLKSSGSA